MIVTRADAPLSDDVARRVEQHLPLVKHIVFQVAVHFPRHVDRDELARAGAMGLVEAARRWDESRGVPFERFVAQRIRGAILDSVRAADWAPRSVRTLARRLEATEQRLAGDLGRLPNRREIAEALGVAESELARLQGRIFRSVVLALEHEVSKVGEESLSLVDILADTSVMEPDEALEHRELLSYLRDAVSLLPERYRLVVVGYFIEGRTSKELAEFLGVTESRISQLRSEALDMLRECIEAQYGRQPESEVSPRAARRRDAYVREVSEASRWSDRISSGASR